MDLVKRLIKGDNIIWIIFILFCAISIIEVFSAASSLTFKSENHLLPITQHCRHLFIGFICLLVVLKTPYRLYPILGAIAYLVSAALLLFLLVMGRKMGSSVNEAHRWFMIFGVQFQPSELAKMATIIVTSSILSIRTEEDRPIPQAFKWVLILTGVMVALIAPENLSTALLLAGVVFILLIISRVEFKKILRLSLFALGILVVLFILTLTVSVPSDTKIPFAHRFPTWKARIMKHTSKEQVPAAKFDLDNDAQIANARIAVAQGGLIGKGPGNSNQRDFLSQAFSDFIYAIIIEELGLIIGGFGVALLYICLLIRSGQIASRAENNFNKLLVMGIAILIASQALINMMVTVGLFPVTGQPLPLISKGGTSTLVNCMYIGIILHISQFTSTANSSDLEEAEDFNETNVTSTTPLQNATIEEL